MGLGSWAAAHLVVVVVTPSDPGIFLFFLMVAIGWLVVEGEEGGRLHITLQAVQPSNTKTQVLAQYGWFSWHASTYSNNTLPHCACAALETP